MDFKVLYHIVIAILASFFITSCDDNIDSVGEGIQPDTDDIIFDIDHVQFAAKTVTLDDYIFVQNDKALLGEISDPKLGKTKADFLAEYYCANASFTLGYDNEATIDSVQLQMGFVHKGFIGDTVKPMTVSVYELNKELEPNFYTNIDPLQYCDMKTILGQRYFSVQDLERVEGGKYLIVELDKKYGQNLYDSWKKDNTVLKNSKELKKIMKGIYVTTDFNDNGIIKFSDANATIRALVYYSYKLKKVNKPDEDSIMVSALPLPIAADAIKLNRVWNTPWDEVTANNPDNLDNGERVFIKAPAGVVTELSIPLEEIRKKGKDKTNSDKFTVNSAIFKLTGLTEEEDKLALTKRPNSLLFINKDSVENFFRKKEITNGLTSMTLHRDSTNNTYNFANMNVVSRTNNLSLLINHYLNQEEYKDTKELKYLLIPIDATLVNSSGMQTVTNIENLLEPAAAILRTKDKYMRASLAFSKHTDIE